MPSDQMGTSVLDMQTPLDRIRGLMEASGTSVKGLAEATAIPRVTLSRRLATPSDFTLAELDRIAAALGVTTMYLMLGDRAAS